MNLNLKPYLYRTFDGDVYLIPVDLIDRFDNLTDLLDEVDVDDYDATQPLFDQLGDFEQYVMEGEIGTIVMWITPDDLT